MPRALSLASSGGSIVLIMIGTINVLPTIIKLTSKLSEQIFSKLFGNVGTLAVKNIKGNKSILNSISLITIGIVTTVIIKNRFNLKEGDKLTLKFPNGERVYTILGFISTSIYLGNYALISDTYLRSDAGAKYYNNVYIKVTGDSNKVLESLENKYEDRYLEGQTLEEMLSAEEENNGQLMSMLIGFSLLALLIGSIGIINNLIISFIERKKSIEVLRSVGMNKKQIVKMVFIEALYSGIVGGTAGIAGGIIVMQIVPYILEAMRVPMRTYVVTDILWIYLVGGVAITVIASVSPASKSSKLNIIEAIKYE